MWEQPHGDCGFPNIPEVREKYKFPLCEIGIDNEEDAKKLQEMIEDVKKIISKNILL